MNLKTKQKKNQKLTTTTETDGCIEIWHDFIVHKRAANTLTYTNQQTTNNNNNNENETSAPHQTRCCKRNKSGREKETRPEESVLCECVLACLLGLLLAYFLKGGFWTHSIQLVFSCSLKCSDVFYR